MTIAKEVTLLELLRRVPKGAYLDFQIFDNGFQQIPVGIYCHKAADKIEAYEQYGDAEVERILAMSDEEIIADTGGKEEAEKIAAKYRSMVDRIIQARRDVYDEVFDAMQRVSHSNDGLESQTERATNAIMLHVAALHAQKEAPDDEVIAIMGKAHMQNGILFSSDPIVSLQAQIDALRAAGMRVCK